MGSVISYHEFSLAKKLKEMKKKSGWSGIFGISFVLAEDFFLGNYLVIPLYIRIIERSNTFHYVFLFD